MLLRAFVLLTLFLAAATPSTAETRQIATVSASQLQSACDKVGGSFTSHPELGSYSCGKADCDGNGGRCIVSCGDQKCHGTTPNMVPSNQTLLSLLQNGDRVLYELNPAPTDSLVTLGEGSSDAPIVSMPSGRPHRR